MLRSVTIEHRQKEAATVDRAADTRLPKSTTTAGLLKTGGAALSGNRGQKGRLTRRAHPTPSSALHTSVVLAAKDFVEFMSHARPWA
jgi:hypothetical protein